MVCATNEAAVAPGSNSNPPSMKNGGDGAIDSEMSPSTIVPTKTITVAAIMTPALSLNLRQPYAIASGAL